jgi:hypothetical protein
MKISKIFEFVKYNKFSGKVNLIISIAVNRKKAIYNRYLKDMLQSIFLIC